MKHTLPLLILSMLFFWGCPTPSSDSGGVVFNTRNFVSNSNYTIKADLLASEDNCLVYVERGQNVSNALAEEIAGEFDNNIYPKITDVFAEPSDEDENGKIILLLLDIQDGYDSENPEGFMAGYFDANDLSANPNYNNADMIYMDTYPALQYEGYLLSTVTHEFQHLVNYAERNGLNGSGLDLGYIDTWINEGLSLGAEYLYSGEYDQSWLAFFYGYYEGSGPGSDFHPPEDSILRGENFFIWEDSDDPDHDLLADYCTAYHFFQWLRIQAGGDEIYSDIFNSSNTDYSDVLSSYNSLINEGSDIEWYEVLQNWYLAMALNQDTGLYGFEDEMGFSDSTLNWVYKENETVDPPLEEAPLRPGEAILDSIDTTFTPGSSESGDIHYLSIDSNSSDGSVNKDGPSYVGDYILVLNGSTVASDDELTVAISASTLPVSISTSLESLAGARSITSTTTRPPYRTDRIISP